MTDLTKNVHVQVLADWTVQYGPIYKFNLSGLDFLVITDPEEVTKLSSRELSLPKANKFYKGLNTVGTCLSPGHLVCFHFLVFSFFGGCKYCRRLLQNTGVNEHWQQSDNLVTRHVQGPSRHLRTLQCWLCGKGLCHAL